jgi:hypothetical protein
LPNHWGPLGNISASLVGTASGVLETGFLNATALSQVA